MRIHLGHHFYGAGNLGDDFMLAGFLAAMVRLAPTTSYSSAVPFSLEPLRRRFPCVEWQPYRDEDRERSIRECDVWLGLGGSPFQGEQSRWFLDHLRSEAAWCRRFEKPMFYLGIGVQSGRDVASGEAQGLIAQARHIWTRDARSFGHISAVAPSRVTLAADLAHIFLSGQRRPEVAAGALAAVANFDYGNWPGRSEFLRAADRLVAKERIWLVQESRPLPGAEKQLYAEFDDSVRARWRLLESEIEGAPLEEVLSRWPSPEWLVTARFHAAIVGLWSGAKVVVIRTNEKLTGLAESFGLATIAADARETEVTQALTNARRQSVPAGAAATAESACGEFVQRASGAHGR